MKEQDDSKAILESISDGVFTVDAEWRITSFNRAAEEITGVSREDALGSYCSEVLRSSLCGKECALGKTLKTGIPVINKSCYFINGSGEKIPITLSTAVLKDARGKIIGGAESFRDVSEIEALKQKIASPGRAKPLQSRSPAMARVIQLVETVAPSESTILIEGETGTGKEVTARAIHALSSRRDEPFLGVNCGALPETLLESTLFGHRKGAFTGAVEDQPGLFARAGRGTLFLDEIGDISPALQVRLLRVLQEQEYEPVGGRSTVKAEARIIAASNKNLKSLMEEGRFRQDLYYRLNVIRIVLPPLRERTEDILSLADSFIEEFNRKHDKKIEGFVPEVLKILQDYPWPGNIRELENVMERACVLCRDSVIGPDCFAFDGLAAPPLPGYGSAMPQKNIVSTPGLLSAAPAAAPSDLLLSRKEEAERAEIIEALRRTGGSRIKAAALLGIHKTTLFRKIKKYHISPSQRS